LRPTIRRLATSNYLLNECIPDELMARKLLSRLPLTPLAFDILLSLAEGDRHGYAILQDAEQRLGGLLPLRTGTLYRALARLLDDGLISEVEAAPGSDERRRNYHLTPLGRQVAQAEARRLAAQLATARAHKLWSED
jgi:DNA-binding PadR family transcriptional regulator